MAVSRGSGHIVDARAGPPARRAKAPPRRARARDRAFPLECFAPWGPSRGTQPGGMTVFIETAPPARSPLPARAPSRRLPGSAGRRAPAARISRHTPPVSPFADEPDPRGRANARAKASA